MAELNIGKKKELRGEIIRANMRKTVVVTVETKKPHPIYKKIMKSRKKYYAHADQDFEIGDKVIIRENRPISKTKKWIVIKKIES